MNLQKIQEIAASCTNCELHKGRNKPVFARGNPQSSIIVCGMCPGPDENKEGYPFVKYAPAGSVLNSILTEVFGSTDSVYITNIVKCFVPPGNPLQKEWVSNCLGYFVAQMGIIKPRVIIGLGGDVCNYLLNKEEKIGQLRGNAYPYLGAQMICTYHPSYLARGGGVKHQHYGRVIDDFKKAFNYV
jgi:DNA polymerase